MSDLVGNNSFFKLTNVYIVFRSEILEHPIAAISGAVPFPRTDGRPRPEPTDYPFAPQKPHLDDALRLLTTTVRLVTTRNMAWRRIPVPSKATFPPFLGGGNPRLFESGEGSFERAEGRR